MLANQVRLSGAYKPLMSQLEILAGGRTRLSLSGYTHNRHAWIDCNVMGGVIVKRNM